MSTKNGQKTVPGDFKIEKASGLPRQEIVEKDRRYVWHPYTPMDDYRCSGDPIVVQSARGVRITDQDGRQYIDGNASWWTSLLGHNHPRLVEALKAQADEFCHVAFASTTHAAAACLAERLAERAPGALPHVFFSDNGSTAVEAAVKMAAQYHYQTGAPDRTVFLALETAFHGETLGATALGGVDAFRRPFDALTTEVIHVPSPGVRKKGETAECAEERALAALEEVLERRAEEIAAFVLEPLIQGAGGMLVHRPSYLRRVRMLTERFDVLLIIDEVFTGFGRTGSFWACDQAGVVPDILCTAKGLSGGLLPFAATLTNSRVFEAFLGGPSRAFYYGHTYAGNALGARVALEVFRVYDDENILEALPRKVAKLQQSFAGLGELPEVAEVRGIGLCAALEIGTSGGGYLERIGWRVFDEAKRRGALIRPLGNVVYLAPALTISDSELDELLGILDESVRVALRK